MFVRYILSAICTRKAPFFLASSIQNIKLWVFRLPMSLWITVIIFEHHAVIIHKSEITIISHCWGLGPNTIICAVRLALLLRQVQDIGRLEGIVQKTYRIPELAMPIDNWTFKTRAKLTGVMQLFSCPHDISDWLNYTHCHSPEVNRALSRRPLNEKTGLGFNVDWKHGAVFSWQFGMKIHQLWLLLLI